MTYDASLWRDGPDDPGEYYTDKHRALIAHVQAVERALVAAADAVVPEIWDGPVAQLTPDQTPFADLLQAAKWYVECMDALDRAILQTEAATADAYGLRTGP